MMIMLYEDEIKDAVKAYISNKIFKDKTYIYNEAVWKVIADEDCRKNDRVVDQNVYLEIYMDEVSQ
tara:strand:+ start:143 stop:340 length:198 start_codon:yes stop_codon:yes gene_type:complete